ncbi:hypothetical protein PTSG_04403 [Salpingoeca rosetta]|uniref:Ras-related protein Rab n=1 Tax=Salpingoeca rosetta (strain ATCC 50818 / BSB-021) TaxID=946362 RepID=F2U8G4_SALR5|nr:uncharacterized protein PTSG_04403 [Salpingoeca rosetta]EGD72672.1 hypothetical protein PTSG_04403 [Salpingoeca rosetta]|eukprot:XP_004994495.1 hypothetical protein PTSG_04403 [Salpingoeca rosetta]
MADDLEPDGPYKVIVIGDGAVGKTSIISRYALGTFDEGYKKTLGVDFALKLVERKGKQDVYLQLWDIAGQDQFSSLTRVYFRHASACVTVFDLTARQTFENVKKWMDEVEAKVNTSETGPVPAILLANKCDLKPHEVSDAEIEEMKERYNFVAWFKTSAKDNTNIDKAMATLVDHIKPTEFDDPEPFPEPPKDDSRCAACS